MYVFNQDIFTAILAERRERFFTSPNTIDSRTGFEFRSTPTLIVVSCIILVDGEYIIDVERHFEVDVGVIVDPHEIILLASFLAPTCCSPTWSSDSSSVTGEYWLDSVNGVND